LIPSLLFGIISPNYSTIKLVFTVRFWSDAILVEFSLPKIDGYYGNMAAHWSDFKDSWEYGGIGHARIYVYQKNFEPNSSCSSGSDRPTGSVDFSPGGIQSEY